PPAAAALRRVGVERLAPASDHEPNRGFAVFSTERDAPQVLHHGGGLGFTCEFNALVEALQEEAKAHAGVTFFSGYRATGAERGLVHLLDKGDGASTMRADRVVAADGRFSSTRKALGIPDDRTPLSNMAGLLLRGVRLPFEGFGHVMLGGVGPVLAYRIAEDAVRVCIDVPVEWKRLGDRERRIWRAIEPQLPPELKEPVRKELEAGHVHWALIELRPRTIYHKDGVALVGDTVGHFHPMTGIGMTLGFGDAVELADHADLDAWARARHRATLSPALLATALYEIFAVDSEPTRACRDAVYGMWEADPAIRERTMAFLSCEDPSMPRLLGVGMRMVSRAAWSTACASATRGTVREGVETVGRIAGLVRWLLSESVPPGMRVIPAVPTTPFEAVRLKQLTASPS
ncbi:MAG TPA: FAD-dependent monooxygenase, partial [Myxococcota bacterium]|nr:FAD-dependent monooxygenase [Myxococcota bacterium]